MVKLTYNLPSPENGGVATEMLIPNAVLRHCYGVKRLNPRSSERLRQLHPSPAEEEYQNFATTGVSLVPQSICVLLGNGQVQRQSADELHGRRTVRKYLIVVAF